MGEPAVLERARETLRLAEVDPAQAIALAADVATAARSARCREAEAVAERAWGLALRHRGDLDTAITHLRRAVRAAGPMDSRTTAAEARMTLAFALAERGRPDQALAEIGRALACLEGVAYARALTQRGTIELELGHHGEAEASYGQALPILRAAGDMVWVRRAVENRGLARAYRHRFRAAEADLTEAVRLGEHLNQPLMVGYTHANLAFVHGLRGDVATALDYSARAEQRIRQHGAQVGALLQDRAELLLSVRLVSEAREAAQQAVEAYGRERRAIKLPEMRLVLAQAALLDGDHEAAAEQARRAAGELTGQRRPEWAAVARLATLRAVSSGRGPASVRPAAVEDVVRRLATSGWPIATMDGRLFAAQVLLGRGRVDQAVGHLRAASAARRRGPATLRARGWYAEALLRKAGGNRRGAGSALLAGLRILDEHRAVLGATDLRARAAGHRVELIQLGLRMAVEAGQPRRVLEWAERGRACELRQRPVRPPEDGELAQRLAELRSTVRDIAELRGTGRGGAAAKLVHRQVALEGEIRDRSRSNGGHSAVEPLPAPVDIPVLAAGLGDSALLELVVLDGALHAVTVVDGRVRLRSLGPVAATVTLLDQVGFALHRLIRWTTAGAGAVGALHLLGHAAGRLEEMLLRPLPEIGDRALVIVPTGRLQCLPWAVLPSCTGRPVTVSPSATLWHGAASSRCEAGPFVAAAGPTLPGADREARAVAAIHRIRPLLPPESTVEAMLRAMDGAALVHMAAHGRLAAYNPLFSDLLLADGPLLAYDLEKLDRAPHTVVLAACDSARSVVCAGDELLGLSAAFLTRGTRQLVASMLPVIDAETEPVMVALHQRLAAGQAPAPALAAAQQQLAGDAASMAAGAGFVCLGAGFAPPLQAGA